MLYIILFCVLPLQCMPVCFNLFESFSRFYQKKIQNFNSLIVNLAHMYDYEWLKLIILILSTCITSVLWSIQIQQGLAPFDSLFQTWKFFVNWLHIKRNSDNHVPLFCFFLFLFQENYILNKSVIYGVPNNVVVMYLHSHIPSHADQIFQTCISFHIFQIFD